MKRNTSLLILGLIVVLIVAGYTLLGGRQEETLAGEIFKHSSVKTSDHCSDWLFVRWFQECPDQDNYGHYLLPCKCWCDPEIGCELNRSKPGVGYKENTSGAACKGVEIKNNCGEKI